MGPLRLMTMLQGVYFNSKNSKKFSIQFAFSNSQLTFFYIHEQIEQKVVWNLFDLDWLVGGNNNSLLFLENRNTNDKLYFELNSEHIKALAGIDFFSPILAQLKQNRSQSIGKSIVGLAILVAIVISLFYWRAPLFSSLGSLIPFSIEKKIADQIFVNKKTSEQIALTNKLENLVHHLSLDSNWKKNLSFHISSNTEPNAYATIGGHIFVNKGLITELDSQEQLLGVIAHEISHIQRRHVVSSLAQAVGVFVFFQILVGDISGVAAVVLDQGGPLLNLQYTRTLEEQADEDALELLYMSQINSLGLSESLSKIQEQQKKLISESPQGEILEKLQKIEILNSHPEIEKRIQSLKERALKFNDSILSNSKQMRVIDFNFQEFQKEIKENF